MKITDRNITKEELNYIYDDFKKIEKQDGVPDANGSNINLPLKGEANISPKG